ncbi:hypothetical protein [Lentzea sp. CA-135723]|uniref:hypothetical protein n=1 Tax=Lentzea sp. CA-135723 TaxID=3239950 RepID=UPI003D918B70
MIAMVAEMRAGRGGNGESGPAGFEGPVVAWWTMLSKRARRVRVEGERRSR